MKDKHLEFILRELKDLPDAQIDPIFKQQAKARIMGHILKTSTTKLTLWGKFYNVVRPISYAMAVILVFVSLGTGTIWAAQSSKPNGLLYPLKTFSEQAALTLSPNPVWKEEIALEVVKRRSEELEGIKKIYNGSSESVTKAQKSLEKSLKKAEVLGVSKDKLNEVTPAEYNSKKEEKNLNETPKETLPEALPQNPIEKPGNLNKEKNQEDKRLDKGPEKKNNDKKENQDKGKSK